MPERLAEHSIVITTKYVTEGGSMMPLQSPGTIVHVHPSGYEVEFPLRSKAFKLETGIDCPDSVVIYCPEDSIKLKEKVQ